MPNNQAQYQPQPSLFVGHGAPDLIFSDIPARHFLQNLGQQLSAPRGVVVVSAHWITSELQITGSSALETIHDFYGWPSELYQVQYSASGDTWLTDKLTDALYAAGFPVHSGQRKGLDHGAWVPLSLMFPKAEIPIIQLSLMQSASPEQHFQIGQALHGLRQEGVLILGSGGLVHNLKKLRPEGSPAEEWAQAFDQWLYERMVHRVLEVLFRYASIEKHAQMAHPSDEHLVPLFLSMGAGWSGGQAHRIHQSYSYGNLSMAAYAFVGTDTFLAL